MINDDVLYNIYISLNNLNKFHIYNKNVLFYNDNIDKY